MTQTLRTATSVEQDRVNNILIGHLESKWLSNLEQNRPHIKHFIDELPGVGRKRGCIVVGAGWSLTEDFEKVRNLDDVDFICTDKAFPRIRDKRRPEYVTSLNTEHVLSPGPKEWLNDAQDTKLICPVTINPEAYENWEGEIYWMVPSNTSENFVFACKDMPTNPIHRGENSGIFAYLMGAFMAYTPIGLIAINYSWERKMDVEPEGTDAHYVKHPGYNGAWVYTSLGWLDSRVDFIDSAMEFYPDIKTINLSKDGIMAMSPYVEFGGIEQFRRLENERSEPDKKI